jgi:hypothetical protein
MNLELNENCEFLQTLSYNSTKRNFIHGLQSDAMIVCMICGSTMKIKAFDFRPDIAIKIGAVQDNVSLT